MTSDNSNEVDKTEYVAYPKAMRLLSQRLKATPEELAAWVFLGPELSGIAAYTNANELSPPRRFNYALSILSSSADYIEPLMACWFNTDDIANFQPEERYITGRELIERWSVHSDIKPRAFILAKIRESRLMDIHPIHGVTEASGLSTQPLETGLFALSEIEEIERSDFISDKTESSLLPKPSGHLNHDMEMQKRANEIARELVVTKKRMPTKDEVAKKLAVEIGETTETVLRRIRAEWKKQSPPKSRNPLHKY